MVSREMRREFDFKNFKGLFKEENLSLEANAPDGINGLSKEGNYSKYNYYYNI